MRAVILSVILGIIATFYFITKETPLTSIKSFLDIDTIEQASITSVEYFTEETYYTYNLTPREIEGLVDVLKKVAVRRDFFYEEGDSKHFLIVQTKYDNEILTIANGEKVKVGFNDTFILTNSVLQNYLEKIAKSY